MHTATQTAAATQRLSSGPPVLAAFAQRSQHHQPARLARSNYIQLARARTHKPMPSLSLASPSWIFPSFVSPMPFILTTLVQQPRLHLLAAPPPATVAPLRRRGAVSSSIEYDER